MLGIIWIVAAWIWPSWRTFWFGLAAVVVGTIGLHALIVFHPNYPWPLDLGHWLRWVGRAAPGFVAATAISALIVWVRTRKAPSGSLP